MFIPTLQLMLHLRWLLNIRLHDLQASIPRPWTWFCSFIKFHQCHSCPLQTRLVTDETCCRCYRKTLFKAADAQSCWQLCWQLRSVDFECRFSMGQIISGSWESLIWTTDFGCFLRVKHSSFLGGSSVVARIHLISQIFCFFLVVYYSNYIAYVGEPLFRSFRIFGLNIDPLLYCLDL